MSNIFRKQSVSLKKSTNSLLFSCFLLYNLGTDKSRRLSRNFILCIFFFFLFPAPMAISWSSMLVRALRTFVSWLASKQGLKMFTNAQTAADTRHFIMCLNFSVRVCITVKKQKHILTVFGDTPLPGDSHFGQTPSIPCWPPSVHLGQLAKFTRGKENRKRIEHSKSCYCYYQLDICIFT